jgi:tetratricopeptide (TPR) repeat protein
MLLIFGVLETSRIMLGSDDNNPDNISRAIRLAPYDSRLHYAEASYYARQGNSVRTIGALEKAVQSNPYDMKYQTALCSNLYNTQKYEQAYARYKEMVKYIAPDADTNMQYALLAAQLKHQDDAILAWKRALAIKPDEEQAHRYLAEAYDSKGELDSAIYHYEQYLRLSAEKLMTETPNAKDIISVTLELGEACHKNKRNEDAFRYYLKAIELASKANEKSLEGRSYSMLGTLFIENEQKAEAIECYKKAIAIDKALGEFAKEGSDWFMYGQIIAYSDASPNLVFACFTRAEELLREKPGPDLTKAMNAREEQELILGKQADSIRKNLETILLEALAFEFKK